MGAVQDTRVEGQTDLIGLATTRLTTVGNTVGVTVGRTACDFTTVGDAITITVGKVFAGIKHTVAIAVGDRIRFTLIGDGAVVAVFRSSVRNIFFVVYAIAIAVEGRLVNKNN